MKTITIILLLLASGKLLATEWWALNKEANQTLEQHCSSVGTFAGLYMSLRQLGNPLDEMMRDADTPLHKEIVMSAFEQPKMSLPENQEDYVNEFKSQWMLKCLKEHPAANQ